MHRLENHKLICRPWKQHFFFLLKKMYLKYSLVTPYSCKVQICLIFVDRVILVASYNIQFYSRALMLSESIKIHQIKQKKTVQTESVLVATHH